MVSQGDVLDTTTTHDGATTTCSFVAEVVWTLQNYGTMKLWNPICHSVSKRMRKNITYPDMRADVDVVYFFGCFQ